MASYGHITYKPKEIPKKKKNDSLSFRLSKPSFLNTSINSKLYKDITKKLATKTTHKKEPTQIHTSSSPPPKILLNQSYKTTYNKKKLQQHNRTTNPVTIRKKIRSISMNAPKMNIQTYPNTTSYRENKEHKKGTYNNHNSTIGVNNNKMKHNQCKLYKQISVVKSSSLHINKPTLPQKRSNSVQKGSYSLLKPNKERSASVKIKNSKRICVLNINDNNNNNKYINLSDRHNNSESKTNGYIRDSYINMIKNIKPKKHSNSLLNSLNSTPNQINIKHDKSLPQSKKFFDKINTDDNNNKTNISNDSIKRKTHKSSTMKYQKISTQIKIIPFRTKQGFDNEIRLKKPRTKSVFTSRSYTLNKETNNNNNINTYKEHSITLPKIIKLESKCNPGISLKKKKVNQDMFFIHENIFEHTDNYIIGVCDGHGPFGHLCSEYIANIFSTRFQSTYKSSYISKTLPQIISSTFSSITHSLLTVQTIDTLISGSTLDVVFILQDKLICANVGDSRCVLGIDSGNDNIKDKYTYIELSKDHHPDDPKEQERIVRKGGTIKQRYDKLLKKYIGPKRVYVKNMDVPGLAMTRSVGDEIGRGVGIISEPDIKEYTLTGNEKFVVLASDGIWEFISSKEVVEVVGRYYDEKDIKGAVDGLIEMACQRWKKKDNYVDDITVIIGFFG